MTLRGNAGRLVQEVNNLSGFVKLTEGPGIQIAQSNAKNSLQFSTVTATLEFDDILANGDSTARSAKFLNNASDTIPAVVVHNTLDFGSGAIDPNVTLKYSPGTPDGLVIGPTTGTDKKILRTDIIGANTSSAIVAKSGMTFDTGLTLTVDNLVAKNVTNDGNVTAHKLKPYDLAGLTIDLDNCTLTCADSVQDPRVSIYPGLNCYGYISGSAGAAISGDFILNNTISTPTISSPIDLILKPSGNVKVFGGKSLTADILTSNSATDLNINSAMNQNININTIGTGVVSLSSVVTPVTSELASGAVSVNTRADFQAGIQTNTIRNQTSGLIITTTGTDDITLNPGGKILVAAGKTLTTDNITSTNALSISAATNQNIIIGATGTGKFYVNGILNVDQINPNIGSSNIVISALPTASSGSVFLNATGTGQVISNKAFITSVIGSPSGFDIVMVPNTGKLYVNGTVITSGIINETLNGNLALAANGTGTINLNSTVIASAIITAANSNLSLTPNGTGQVIIGSGKTLTVDTINSTTTNSNLSLTANGTGQIQIASGKTLATDIIKSNGATAIAVKTNTTFDASLILTADNIISKSISVNGNVTASKLLPYDQNGLTINLDTCTLTCADNVPSPMITINPQLLVNGTLNCMAGASFSGNVMINNEVTTPYNVTATDLKLNPTGNVRVIGNKTLFCNAISQNDTNTDLYLTAGGTNQNVVISPAGTGQVQVLTGKTLSADNIVSKSVTVNGNVTAAKLLPYDTAGLTVDLNNCTLSCNDAVADPKIILSSPVLANILTVNTIKSADATNLTINSPGGTINTNATNITASTTLTLNATSGFIINTGSVAACSLNNINVLGDASILGSAYIYTKLFTATGNIEALFSNTIIKLTTTGTGYVSIPNTGLRLPNGATTFNWYEEATLTGTWSNTTTPAVTSTIYIVRVGKQVTLQIVSPNITSSNLFAPSFSTTLPSKFIPVSSIICPTSSNSSTVSISGLGIIALSNYTFNASNNVEIHTSYFTNAVSSSGASGQIDPGNGDGSGSGSGDGSGSGGTGGASGSGGSDGSSSGGTGGTGDITGGSGIEPKP